MSNPPRVDDPDVFWSEPPPVLSARCVYWMGRIVNGWRPSRRIAGLGYYSMAGYLGVFIWEQCNVIYPMLSGHPAPSPAKIDPTRNIIEQVAAPLANLDGHVPRATITMQPWRARHLAAQRPMTEAEEVDSSARRAAKFMTMAPAEHVQVVESWHLDANAQVDRHTFAVCAPHNWRASFAHNLLASLREIGAA